MKKSFFIVFNLFMFFLRINTNAETYYGEYKLLEDSSLINNYKNDEVLIKEKKLYNTYKKHYKDLGYLLDNDDYIKDENDFIEEYTLLDDYLIDSDEYININSKINNLMHIRFANILTGVKIYEILVYYNDKEISYRYFYNNFEDFIRAFDYKFDTYNYSTKDNSFINLVFEQDYLLENIKIVIYTDNIDINFDIIINSLDTKNINFNGNKHIITFNKVKEDIEYKYGSLVKKNRYYALELLPTNNYIDCGENIILDDYIIDYDYYIRNKLVLKDDIVIKDFNTGVNNFIEYSTGDVNSVCNIDYNINGEYYCNFVLNDINVHKKVLVDIKREEVTETKKEENTKKDEIVIEEKNNLIIDNVNNMEDDVLNSNIEIDIPIFGIEENINNNVAVKDNNIEEGIIEDSSRKDYIISEDIVLDNENVVTKDKNSIKSEDITNNINEKKNIFLFVIKYVFIILVILIEVILFIKKKKNKRNVEDI